MATESSAQIRTKAEQKAEPEQVRPQGGTLEVPGFGLPLTRKHLGNKLCFPHLLLGEWHAATLLVREVCMLKFVEDITNKPEWWLKVRNPDIVAKWKDEVLAMPWPEYRTHGDFTQEMADACILELQEKADLYEKTGLIPVMDYSACAIKSDRLIPQDLREALQAAVAPLEAREDWHPGSGEKVLDLVHPSLWPLIYGRSRILPDRRIGLHDCLDYCGAGDLVPEPAQVGDGGHDRYRGRWGNDPGFSPISSRFQWLPCDVDLMGEHPRIESYINGLHPIKHATLYPIIERFIEKALPAWDVIYDWPANYEIQRMHTMSVIPECQAPGICKDSYDCIKSSRPLGPEEEPRQEDEEYEDWYRGSDRERRDLEWYKANHKIPMQGPSKKAEDLVHISARDVKDAGFFNGAPRIQVIVKLANIHLTPDKPRYEGGSWHVEGQLNERICSTALFYYDCDNITDCHLDFRTRANKEDLMMELNYHQSDWDNIERTFAVKNAYGTTMQDIGSVLTRENRALFFPNVYLHHVSPFELVDKSRPGHRKILALFLVDPQLPIISTANVPPQQQEWWAERFGSGGRLGNLPPELTRMVMDNTNFPIHEEEAKRIREELMEERTQMVQMENQQFTNEEFNFCEH